MTTSIPPAGDHTAEPDLRLLRGGGTALLLDCGGPGQILYWGADLGDLSGDDLSVTQRASHAAIPFSSLDQPRRAALIPEALAGHRGAPGLAGFRAGRSIAPRLVSAGRPTVGQQGALILELADPAAGLAVTVELHLDAAGVLRVRHTVINTSLDPFQLAALTVTLPIPAAAQEICDFTGKWLAERAEQRIPLRHGAWVRENRRGRTGHDASFLTMVGTQGFSHRAGEVWAAHLGWSGNQVMRVESASDGTAAIVAGELLEPGEITLEPGGQYRTPWVYATYSGTGVDGITARLHRHIRSRATHPARPRPVVLNTWEAVYFDHDLATLARLAEIAAGIGVERFVLDDGWFGSRRSDASGLGDWTETWPERLGRLARRVTELGMEFGLWVEPEMVNPDSDLYRAHPEWLLADPDRLPPLARNQLVLDVARPEVAEYLFERLDALVKRYRIAFLKWDHNRDVIGAVHAGRAGVHAQTTATYALIDRLRAANPGLEIESCASGGARADLGMLARTDRVWASDCNDPLERQQIQRGTRTLLPLELIGSHLCSPRSHTTSRSHGLGFRAATALFGHMGIEWDIAGASAGELEALAAVIAEYRRLRPLLHTGELVTVDHPDPTATLFGVVAVDRSRALFCLAQLAMSRREVPAAARLPGLDPQRRYRVRPLVPAGPPAMRHNHPPPWLADGEITVLGAVLDQVGLALPCLDPEQALLIELTEA